MEDGESTYDNALPRTRIAAVPHTRYGHFSPILAKLDALHDARIAGNREFDWWAQNVAEYHAENAKKYISLNQAERRGERDRQEANVKQRQVERKALGLDINPLADNSADDRLTANERDIIADVKRQKAAEDHPDPLPRESAASLADVTALLAHDQKLTAVVSPLTHPALHWAE